MFNEKYNTVRFDLITSRPMTTERFFVSADRIEQEDDFIIAYNDNTIVAMVKKEFVRYCSLTDECVEWRKKNNE